MALYAIGDVQGCFEPLQQLLSAIHFNAQHDQLWFTGDLVNRGPHSLQTLRFVRDLGNRAITVLGNHDLHLLAVAQGLRPLRDGDTFADILEAPDREELLTWLRHRPLLHYHPDFNTALVHAGLAPQWTLTDAQRCARDVEITLQNNITYGAFLENMYGSEPDCWDTKLIGWPRLRFIVNAFTRMRYCTREGKLDFKAKLSPEQASGDLIPWFQVPERKNQSVRVVCGHWSTLGYRSGRELVALDTGCVWGGQLTAARIERETVHAHHVACPVACDIGSD